MDDVVNRLARELVEAIAASAAADPRVEACREKGRAAGYEMQVSLEAVIGFASRQGVGARSADAASTVPEPDPSDAVEISDTDRRFLRSLRIAVDDVDEETEEVE